MAYSKYFLQRIKLYSYLSLKKKEKKGEKRMQVNLYNIPGRKVF